MKNKLTPLGILSIGILWFTAACASASTAATANPPVVTNPPAATTAAPVATDAPAATSPAATTASSSGSLKFVIVPAQSTASYKVREQLANANLPNDAIGSTNTISGTLEIAPDGTLDAASSKFTVDLSTLKTDRSMRDNYVRREILGTDQFPQAVFVPTQVTGLPNPLPQSGNVTFKLTGNLTIRDTTKPVTWDVTGQIQNGQLSVKATTSLTFEDFNLNQPHVSVVLSVEDHIALEMDLVLQQAQ